MAEATVSQEQVFETLKTVYDPEIPVNIVDLGLIYDVQVNGSSVSSDETLSGDDFDRGDHITVTVTPWDDEEAGDAVTSETAIAINTPPTLDSITGFQARQSYRLHKYSLFQETAGKH